MTHNPQYRKPPPRPPDMAKLAARAAGQKKFQGSPCVNGHSGIRYSSTGQCVDCLQMYREIRRPKPHVTVHRMMD